MGFFGSIGKLLGGAAKIAIGGITSGPIGAVAAAASLISRPGQAPLPQVPTVYDNPTTFRMIIPPPPYVPEPPPPPLPQPQMQLMTSYAGSGAGAGPVNSFQPPALTGASSSVKVRAPAKLTTKVIRKAAKKTAKKKSKKKGKLKFGSAAYRKKYLGHK